MTRLTIVALAVLVLVLPTARAQDTSSSSEQAMYLAKKITTEGAAAFDKHDAKLMAANYMEEAVVTLMGKDQTGYKVTPYKGRAEIERLYRDVFKGSHETQSRNIVEFAQLVAPDVLVIYGTFEPNKGDMKLPFQQVRVKQGEKWLISSLRVFVLPQR
jgi:ketosteroid isomerase-like protein